MSRTMTRKMIRKMTRKTLKIPHLLASAAAVTAQACSVAPKAHMAQGSALVWAATNGTRSCGLEVWPTL